MKRQPTNLGASIRARLETVARKRDIELQAVLSEYAIERILYRIGASPHADRFILKAPPCFASGPRNREERRGISIFSDAAITPWTML